MGGGGFGGFISDIVDTAVNINTFGTVGFDFDEGIKKGIVTEGAIDVLKDVTGATAAEEANKDARARFEEEKARAAEKRKEAKATSARDQVIASRAAGSARGGIASQKSGSGSRFSPLGGDESDFLGL